MELDFAKAGMHMFVEKPVSVQSAEEVGELAEQLEECYKTRGSIITAGYMLRYSAWVPRSAAVSVPTMHSIGHSSCACGYILIRNWVGTHAYKMVVTSLITTKAYAHFHGQELDH